jgi:predicted nucleic acid-binding Zn ribbon protein
MERVNEFLGAAMRRVGDPATPMAWIRATWTNLAGEQLARRTLPFRMTNGCLEITVRIASEAAALRGLEEELRGRINRAWGRNLLREVRFCSVPARLPYEIDNAHLPFIRKGSQPPRTRKPTS